MIKYKVRDVAKDLGVSVKEISDILEKSCGVTKKAMATLEESELNIGSTQGVSATVMPWAMTVRRPSAAFSIFNPRPAASSAGIAATLFSGCKVAGSSNPMRGSARVTLSNSCARAVISVCSSSRV